MDYYDTLVDKVKILMKEENYNEAYSILKEELNMPYIPYTHEETLQKMFLECKQELSIEKRATKYHQEDIETLLFGSVDEACMACEILKGSNIRNYLDIVETYLKKEPNYLIRTLLIETLMEQDVTDEIQLNYEGLMVEFKPTYVQRIQDRDETKIMVQKLSDYFENDNPTFYRMCVDSLMKELYLKLPFSVDEDELDYALYAIIEYVYKANGDEEAFKRFIHEKNLAMYKGYDLLLYKYEI